jgi:tetratricopeptide (TPR) repeat protein
MAEAYESTGRFEDAAQAFSEVPTHAPSAPERAAAAFGRLRIATARADDHAQAGALSALAALAEGDEARAFAREAALLRGLEPTSSQNRSDEPQPDEPLFTWLAAVRARDPVAETRAWAAFASASPAGPGTRTLWLDVAARCALCGDPGADAALAAWQTDQPLSDGDAAMVQTLSSDLLPSPARDGLRVRRAQRLASGSVADRELARALELESGLETEHAPGQHALAAAAYARAAELHPRSVAALSGLARLLGRAGERDGQAQTLERLGDVLATSGRAAQAHAEAALLFEAEGRADDAARTFAKVLTHSPDDDEAFRRLGGLLRARENWKGLEGLLSFKLGRTSAASPRVRVSLYLERAHLRLEHLRARTQGIDDLKRALALDDACIEALSALARLALGEDRHVTAGRLLSRALEVMPESTPRGVRKACLLHLAEACEGTGDLDAAARMLQSAHQVDRDDEEARERLVAVHVRRGRGDEAIAMLRALPSRSDREASAILGRIARLARDHLNDPWRALESFVRALTLEPSSDVAFELAPVLARAATPLTDNLRADLDAVIARLRAHLALDPLDVTVLERVAELEALVGRASEAEVARQIAGLLGAGGAKGRARTPTGRLLRVDLLALADSPVPDPLVSLWSLAAPAVARVLGADPAAVGASKPNRLAAGADPRLGWAFASAAALELPSVGFFLGTGDELAVFMLEHPEPALVIGRGVLGGDPPSRFRVARALALVHMGASVVDALPPAELTSLFAALARLANAQGVFAADADADLVRRLGKALSRKDLRALEQLGPALAGQALDPGVFVTGLRRAANRFALAAAGDVADSVRVLLGAVGAGPPSPESLRDHAEARDLVAFALSPRFQTLRGQLGISGDDNRG